MADRVTGGFDGRTLEKNDSLAQHNGVVRWGPGARSFQMFVIVYREILTMQYTSNVAVVLNFAVC